MKNKTKKFVTLTRVACVAGAASACSGPQDPASDDDLYASISAALRGTSDVASVLIDAQGARRGVTRCVDVDGETTTTVSELPTGEVTITAHAFDAAGCSGNQTWYTDPIEVVLRRGILTPVVLRFLPNGTTEVSDEYVDVDAEEPTRCQTIEPDANTVLLEHFEGATSGNLVGTSSFVDGAIEFGTGGFAKFPQPAAGTSRTVEFCVQPLEEPSGELLLDYNWENTNTRPPAGHVFTMLRNNNAFHVGVWNSVVSANQALAAPGEAPAGEWTHVAITFSPSISRAYVNGREVASAGPNFYPDGSPTTIYLNGWGGSSPVRFDELHISSVARSAEEIADHAGR